MGSRGVDSSGWGKDPGSGEVSGDVRTLINSLVETVGLVQNDVAWIHHRFVNNWVNRRAKRQPDQVQMLVEHKGRLIPIEEPIDSAKRRPTPHPSQIIDLTDDSDDVMPGSSGSLVESIRDFRGGGGAGMK